MYKCISCSIEGKEVLVKGIFNKEKKMFECEKCGSIEIEQVYTQF